MSKAQNCDPKTTPEDADGLALIAAALESNPDPRPVWDWAPTREIELDIHIRGDGSWEYLGTPIRREALVRLFASVLRRDGDGRHYLVTPAEKVAIKVEDAPFLAVHMDVAGDGLEQVLGFRTNVGDYVQADADHPIRFERVVRDDGIKPYIEVRRGLEALATRALSFEILDLCVPHRLEDAAWMGVWSAGCFFPVMREDEIA